MYDDLVKSLKLCGTSLQPYENDCVTNHDGCCEAEPTCMYELMRKAADAIEDLSEQLENETEYATALNSYVPQWIPVTERLPDFEGCVLCMRKAFVGDKLRYQDILYYDEGTFYMEFDDTPIPTEVITHWMPLPEPPEESES